MFIHLLKNYYGIICIHLHIYLTGLLAMHHETESQVETLNKHTYAKGILLVSISPLGLPLH